MVGLREDLRLALDRVAFAKTAGLDLDRWQQQVLKSASKRILLNCSRQSGKTTIVAALVLHRALYVPRSYCLVFSPSLDQSVEFFKRVANLCHALGLENVDPEAMRKTGMDLKNGSRIEARPGNEKTSRGRTADLLVVDEAARIDSGLYHGIRPSLAVTGGSLVMLSTPYGRRGVFWEEWSGPGDWERYEVTAEDCPRISAEFLAEEERRLPPRVFRREYMCSFEETEDAVFTSEILEAAFSNDLEPLWDD